MSHEELVSAFKNNALECVCQEQAERAFRASQDDLYSTKYLDKAVESGIPTLIKFATEEKERSVARLEAEREVLRSLLGWKNAQKS